MLPFPLTMWKRSIINMNSICTEYLNAFEIHTTIITGHIYWTIGGSLLFCCIEQTGWTHDSRKIKMAGQASGQARGQQRKIRILLSTGRQQQAKETRIPKALADALSRRRFPTKYPSNTQLHKHTDEHHPMKPKINTYEISPPASTPVHQYLLTQ